MERPEYLNSFKFNWESLDVIVSGRSSLDADYYFNALKDRDDVIRFLQGYGFDITDPVQNAELFGNFQEAIQFIKRYFLKEGNPEGLDVTIPNTLYSVTDIADLFLMATGLIRKEAFIKESLWAGIILKVMHTILHTDKDLRYRYFSTIQQQVLDRFYKFLHRDDSNKLFLGTEENPYLIPLFDFETKSKKTRESIIIKLLHKRENVAEELFDRIGIRFITESRVDSIRVIKFLYDNYVIMVNNIKPSRSYNTLLDLDSFQEKAKTLVKKAIKEGMGEQDFYQEAEKLALSCTPKSKESDHNEHSLADYRAIHFTCRQLIKYKNPFLKEFNKVKKVAKNMQEEDELANLVLSIDTSSIAGDIRFFYPFEVQVTDHDCHLKNTEGSASHEEYKKQQLFSAMKRLFRPLLDFEGIELD